MKIGCQRISSFLTEGSVYSWALISPVHSLWAPELQRDLYCSLHCSLHCSLFTMTTSSPGNPAVKLLKFVGDTTVIGSGFCLAGKWMDLCNWGLLSTIKTVGRVVDLWPHSSPTPPRRSIITTHSVDCSELIASPSFNRLSNCHHHDQQWKTAAKTGNKIWRNEWRLKSFAQNNIYGTLHAVIIYLCLTKVLTTFQVRGTYNNE